MSDKTELKPCPFCGPQTDDGKRIVLLEEREADGFVRGYTVRCDNCGVEHSDEYEHEAIAAWNRRASSTAPAASVTEAELSAGVRALMLHKFGSDAEVMFDIPADAPQHAIDAVKARLEEARREVSVVLSAARAVAPAVVPDGWKLVPVEPTPEIVTAMGDVLDSADADGEPCWHTEAERAYRAALSAAPASPTTTAQGWQDIATAPKDGTEVLIYAGAVFTACWTRGYDNIRQEHFGCFVTDAYDKLFSATHWMPLPSAPSTSAGEG
ncbi:Lar family restriction alleviation protein [Azospirillum rugosum]|uniref:DUF551 domain-containing protein n=1 Tax=Azospirillum rugosum TaxID=416170 RepID=A0ABS4SEZ4_9PROT|nr:Lar family restriction alleviation protein [Azospirillum rugosum]MBP2290764.1 hypothetical protein [Azospirillum rugosum]MDQ0525653.1 hypothetical protein [Azospirillum rugosum]